MSLLNDALRAAEERQQRPDVSGAYTGGAVQSNQGGSRWAIIILLLLVLGVAAAGLYWLVFFDRPSTVPEPTGPGVEQGSIERAPQPEISEPQPNNSEPRPRISETEPQISEPESQAPETEPVAEMQQPTAQPTEVAEPARPAVQAPQSQSPEEPVVKTIRQTPAAMDRKTARELEKLVSSGRMVEAERQLASLTQSQAAPRSRFVVARALLVDGDTNRAIGWLPEQVAANDSRLRMLRARAQHAGGQLDEAVATLQAQVPPVAEQPEYWVTLATLLQQQGQGQEAAAIWAELIAWDDSRAPWWVGLAIALEDQGETRSATRAYEQAAALPGLPPSLADYVQRRLRSLRAG